MRPLCLLRCEVDDVDWVRCFTRHGVPRPAKACLLSPRSPQPQGLPRHPQWRGRQGPHGASQGSSRTSGGRPQPHTQGAAPHTNLLRSSTPNGIPAETSTNKYMQCHHANTKTYDTRKGALSLGDCGSSLHFRRVRQLTSDEEVRLVVQEGLEAAISRAHLLAHVGLFRSLLPFGGRL